VSTGRHDHWEAVWRDRAPDQLSWHQEHAERSLAIITTSLDRLDALIIDVGAGDSPLAGDLLRAGFTDLTVLDISEAALTQGRRRLGARAGELTWVAADVTTFAPERSFQLWHDRAVFHFLTEEADQRSYVETASAAVARGGWLVMATFALDAPEQCSGLPVRCRQNAQDESVRQQILGCQEAGVLRASRLDLDDAGVARTSPP
jgi:SAM-dependent methyltransferase